MKRMNTTPLLSALLLLASLAPRAAAQDAGPEVLMLQLRDGAFRFGTIQSHDAEGFLFTRLDNGGVARLPWSLLDPRQSDELRRRFGYVDLAGEEITMMA